MPQPHEAGSSVCSTSPVETAGLHQDVAAALSSASGALKSPALVSVDLPVDLLPAALRGSASELRGCAQVLWERPGETSMVAGFGAAIRACGARESSFADAAAAAREAASHVAFAVTGAARPRIFIGARFAPGGAVHEPAWDAYGGWQILVPEVLVAVEGGRIEASLTLMIDPSEPGDFAARVANALSNLPRVASGAAPAKLPAASAASAQAWQASVAAALDEIGAGDYQKVVLARLSHGNWPRTIDQGAVLSALAQRYPHCFVFAFRSAGLSWMGATPELLASRRGDSVLAASLAGSKPRGADAAEDARLAAELLGSPKERAEHAVVAEGIRESLAPLCAGLSAPETPHLLRLPNIQHLHTPVTGTLRPGFDLLDVVEALHPTPAVGGWPRLAALDAIERLEAMDRGWYAGPIGWIDLSGDGEFAVGLRSALVGDASAHLYAGAGIVMGSEPAVEYAETEAKLRPLRDALGAVLGAD